MRIGILSNTVEPITSGCGIALQPSARLGDPAGFDYAVVIGGSIADVSSLSGKLVRFLRRAAGLHVRPVGVFTINFILH